MLENVPSWLLRLALWVVSKSEWLSDKLNRFAINSAVEVCRTRPHPWSTAHDYVSWTSLTDMRWSARHLPAVRLDGLPAPETLREMFRAPGTGQRPCEKSTCLFPAFAQYLTDGFIRTRSQQEGEPDDVRRQNTSNHQIDLCPLYGRTPAQTAILRLRDDTAGRRGRLKSQILHGEEYAPFLLENDAVKAEFAGLDAPLGLSKVQDPAQRAVIFAFGGDRANATAQVAMLNTLFLREHNRVAGEIERLNPAWDDDHVFEVARNIVIVLFIKIVVEEYINHIAPLPVRLRADPRVAWTADWNRPNWITTEFSLLYRWHSLIPDTIVWKDKSYPVGATPLNNRPLLEAGLTRAFIDMSTQRATRLGAFNTAAALVDLEILAIRQGRACDVAPFWRYCEYVGLPVPRSFEDITKDAGVVAFLRQAYGDVSKVDFYVGLFAQETVKNSPLPPLTLRMVAVDAFSQALTNPLLSEHVFKEETFTPFGWTTISQTSTLRDVVARNSATPLGDARISMTRAGWKHAW
ncbi:MAG: heme peroxidase [Alphaproteobacteria bacterium]|nr:heme peroxidase [Alphaproteobacteria bacterium]